MNIDSFLDMLFTKARSRGFDAFEAVLVSSEMFEAGVFDGQLIDYSSAKSSELGFKALTGGKLGYASTQAFDESAADMLVESAANNAELIESGDEHFIFPGSPEYSRVDCFNPAAEDVPISEKIEWAMELERLVKSKSSEINQVDGCASFSSSQMKRIVNSRGLDLSHRSNMLGGYVSPVARRSDKTSSRYDFFLTNDPSKIDLDGVASRAVRESMDGLDAESIPSGTYPAIFRSDAASSLLATFCSIFSADAAQKGLSLLGDKLGKSVASPVLTIVDDPLIPNCSGSTPFDGEGVACRRKEVISSGNLNTLLHNLKTARKAGVETTGNASQSHPVGVAPTNLFIKPGDNSLSDMSKIMGKGLVITQLTGLHAGANPISGDFSLSAQGYTVDGGRVCNQVDQITVAGNFYELMKSISMVGSDLRFGLSGSCGSPSVMVEGISVSGK